LYLRQRFICLQAVAQNVALLGTDGDSRIGFTMHHHPLDPC
jgi:hypothetical protein